MNYEPIVGVAEDQEVEVKTRKKITLFTDGAEEVTGRRLLGTVVGLI